MERTPTSAGSTKSILYINRRPIVGPYGGGNQAVKALYELLPSHGFDIETSRPDIALLIGLDSDGDRDSASLWDVLKHRATVNLFLKVVLRVNECDARKGTQGVDEAWLEASKRVDGTIFVSEWMRDYFSKKGWSCKNNVVIVNGVDKDVFKSREKLNNGKVNIVCHHWSDNAMKSGPLHENITEKLDEFVGKHSDKFAFTFIGRLKTGLKHSRIIAPLFGEALGAELGRHDVYVSASQFDPGPNHICESISCELPTYVHKDGGGSVEFAGRDHVFDDWKHLEQILLTRHFEPNDARCVRSWSDCITDYATFLQNLPGRYD